MNNKPIYQQRHSQLCQEGPNNVNTHMENRPEFIKGNSDIIVEQNTKQLADQKDFRQGTEFSVSQGQFDERRIAQPDKLAQEEHEALTSREFEDQRPLKRERFSDELIMPSKSLSTSRPFGNSSEMQSLLKSKLKSFFNQRFRSYNDPLDNLGMAYIDGPSFESEIASQIISGIKEEASGLNKEAVEEAQDIAMELNKSLKLRVFYMSLIRSYTKESFLYNQVNRLLRQENWQSMKNLLPYIFYLLDALMYLCPKVETFYPFQNKTMTLYRGCNLSKEHISEYTLRQETKECFSWLSFTSLGKSQESSTQKLHLLITLCQLSSP